MRRRAWLLALLFAAPAAEAREPLPPLPRLPLATEQAPAVQPDPIRPGPLVLTPRAPAGGASPAPDHTPAPGHTQPAPPAVPPSAKPTAPASQPRPRLALIIDDLGQTPERDRRVLALPATVALAIIPETPHATDLARRAHDARRTVMLHLPMDPAGGPFAWHPDLPEAELARRLDAAFAAVPYSQGVNNHMGSRMTAQPEAMAWLMRRLQADHRFFVDSRTSAATVAAAEAQKAGLASLSRDVFLDDDQHPEAIARQFEAALSLARKQGTAVMIGHPHPATLALLERELPRLAERGFELVSVPQMIALRSNRAMAAHGKGGQYR
ncbi:divergent polysaccharide deacetylase family protein [Pseudomonas sp. 1D4]|uniref:divergent polysaccharide deacetylase family protein n=1 Tax=Pseudomonas sp. 1D4 TaxID=1843691 RepID=UPI0009F6CF07